MEKDKIQYSERTDEELKKIELKYDEMQRMLLKDKSALEEDNSLLTEQISLQKVEIEKYRTKQIDLQQQLIDLQQMNTLLIDQKKMQEESLQKQSEIQSYIRDIDSVCNQLQQEKLAYEKKIKELVSSIVNL